MLKRLIPLLLAALLICGMSIASFASEHPLPDLSQKGSISISLEISQISGGDLTLYRVGEVHEDDGNYSYIPTGDFADCGERYDNVGSADLAKKLEKYAKEHNLDGQTKVIGQDGEVTFDELELGLYLIVHKEIDGSVMKANPFLVTVPQLVDGKYIYDIEATLKVQLIFVEGDDDSDKPPEPDPPKLPQTGQLNWPVPVMTVAGLGLFAAGFTLFSGRKKNGNET